MVHVDVLARAQDAVPFHPSRPAATVIRDTTDARLVVFRLKAGQSVPPHTNRSTVILTVLSGEGRVSGGDGEAVVSVGSLVAFEPRELHGIQAPASDLVVLAIIAPSPRDQ